MASPSATTTRHTPLSAVRRPLGRQERIVEIAVAVIAGYLLVDAVFGGAAAWLRIVEGLAAIVLVPAFMAAFLAAGRLGRGVLAWVAGLLATVAGLAGSVAQAVLGGEVTDYAGVLLAVSGLVLLGVAFAITFAGRRIVVKLLALPLLFVLLQWVVLPAVVAGIGTSARHDDIAGAASLGLAGARDVTFPSSDGVELAGWYAPGRNGAAVILAHGSHGDRESTLPQLRSLTRAGYAVLAYDARGHGDSDGDPNALGWTGAADVAGAVAFLRREGVDPDRIGMLGLSMGGEEALRAAAEDGDLSAVVADGAGAATRGDQTLLDEGAMASSVTWASLRLASLVSGDDEPAPLKDIVAGIDAPVLLIASNAEGERTVDAAYQDRIGADAELWYVPDAGHTKADSVHPQEYEQRVLALFDSALGG
jgi:uncharacterized protein